MSTPKNNENKTGDSLPKEDCNNLEDAEWTTYRGHYDDSDRTDGQKAEIEYPKIKEE